MTAYDPRSACMGKIRYETKGQAKLALDRLRPRMFRCKWRKFKKMEPQEMYHCPCCRGWHLGTKL